MLQISLTFISVLNQVKVELSHDKPHGKSCFTYGKYKTLLLSATSTYDVKLGHKKGRVKQTIYQSEISPDTTNSYDSFTLMSHETNLHKLW